MATLKVAVIGAGVAGLCTARELQREGHHVVVYEKSEKIGGTWFYNPKVETDPLGLDPNRKIVHSSLYSSLHTNLPRTLMGFSDYPFPAAKIGEPRNFPGHEVVLRFLNDFASEFGLTELVRFNTEVLRVQQVSPKDNRWVVESRNIGNEFCSEEIFEAVVVCNGHNTHPRVTDIAGIRKWPGKQIHSHNYRVSQPFQDQVVVVIGNGPSAHDISKEIAQVAKEVHLSSRSPGIQASKVEMINNMWQHTKIDYCHENGEISFDDGASVDADVILHCTGYQYDLPFLRTNGIVSVDDNRVGPLFKHVFPPQLAPELSFVGITNRVVSFPLLELQAKWVAHVLSGKVQLPSKEEMLADVEEHYRLMEQNGVPKHHTHTLPFGVGGLILDMLLNASIFEYMDWVAAQVGVQPLDDRLKDMCLNILKILLTSWVGFREQCDNWISEHGF